jgi:hypothetical protein
MGSLAGRPFRSPVPLRVLDVLEDFFLLGAVPEPCVASRLVLAFGGGVDVPLDGDPVEDAVAAVGRLPESGGDQLCDRGRGARSEAVEVVVAD